jgi:large subunit ribosomal protein L6
MSRIGKKPIIIPDGVVVKIEKQKVLVTGPKGSLERVLPSEIKAEMIDGQILVNINKKTIRSKAFWGLFRSLLANDIQGVTEGFQKELEMVGVGYRARLEGSDLIMEVGFSHEVRIKPDPGIEFQVLESSKIVIRGMRKDQVGQVAHAIRKVRPPEPYKGKGIRYVGEQVRRKESKKTTAGT